MTRQERRVGDEDDLDADVDKPFPRHWMTLHLRGDDGSRGVEVRRTKPRQSSKDPCNSLKVRAGRESATVVQMSLTHTDPMLRIFPDLWLPVDGAVCGFQFQEESHFNRSAEMFLLTNWAVKPFKGRQAILSLH